MIALGRLVLGTSIGLFLSNMVLYLRAAIVAFANGDSSAGLSRFECRYRNSLLLDTRQA
jgi:hypothetical protein